MAYADRLDTDIDTFLKRHEQKELLRFVTLGSVDDGKSTLIGRLLHDVDCVYEDQLDDARQGTNEIDFALITDGLVAEREQGITIDVAYRYFTTQARKFIIADSPGHVQYTRNMATGASTADVAIILIDARNGVQQQSRRHAYIASLLGIPHLVVCINKMDAVDYNHEVFDAIWDEFHSFSSPLGFTSVIPLPVSALCGDNVVERSSNMAWFEGSSLLELLETLPVGVGLHDAPLRFPVQYVIRPNQNYRGYAGQVASGVVRPGDTIQVLPSGTTSRVASIDLYEGSVDEAFAPMSVSLTLEDELDISRGDVLVHQASPASLSRTIDATVVWMGENSLRPPRQLILKHMTRYVRAEVTAVEWRLNMDTLAHEKADTLELNAIGKVKITTHQPVVFDAYSENRGAGCFVVVDPLSNNTIGAGMILANTPEGEEKGAVWSAAPLSAQERTALTGQSGVTILILGPDGEEKDALVFGLERLLCSQGTMVHALHPQSAGNPAYGKPLSEALTIAETCTAATFVSIVAVPHSATQVLRDAQKDAGTTAFITVRVGAAVTGSEDIAFDLGSMETSEAAERVYLALQQKGFLNSSTGRS